MSIVNYFKDKLLGKFFSKTETAPIEALPPEDETFDVPEVTDEDVEAWMEEGCEGLPPYEERD